MPPIFTTFFCSSSIEMTGSGVSVLNSVLCALASPSTSRAKSTTRDLQAEAEAQVGNLLRARIAGGEDLALDAAHAEAARHEDAVEAGEEFRRAVLLDFLRVDRAPASMPASAAAPAWVSAS